MIHPIDGVASLAAEGSADDLRPMGPITAGMSSDTRDDYGPLLATVYDSLAWAYSAGAIGACKRWGVAHLQPGSSVLFAGAGSATEVVDPVRGGVHCDIVDRSAAMLSRARKRLQRCGLEHQATMYETDLRFFEPGRTYDAVVAHFFLNVFDTTTMLAMMERMQGLLRPKGLLIVGDFAMGHQFLQMLYHDLPMHLFSRWTDSALHEIHDVAAAAQTHGFRLTAHRFFRWGRLGPPWFGSWVFER